MRDIRGSVLRFFAGFAALIEDLQRLEYQAGQMLVCGGIELNSTVGQSASGRIRFRPVLQPVLPVIHARNFVADNFLPQNFDVLPQVRSVSRRWGINGVRQ